MIPKIKIYLKHGKRNKTPHRKKMTTKLTMYF